MGKKSSLLLVFGLGCVLFAGCTKAGRSGPPKEKVFRMGLEAKVPSIDPLTTTDVYSAVVQSLVYDSLFEYHYLKRPYSLTPALAAALPEISKDNKKLKITLKKGILFQDDPCFEGGKGREVTSQDIAYIFYRISAPKVVAPYHGSFEHNIVGIDDYHAGKTQTISGVKTPDRYTIEIELTHPLPRFVYNFTDSHTAVVPKECVEKYGDQFARHPVGTGPFHIVQADLSYKIVAERNPNYKTLAYPTEGSPGDREAGLLEDAGRQLPLVDKVVIEINAESQPRWLKFLAGEYEYSGVPKDSVQSALPDGKLSPELAALGIRHLRQPIGDVTLNLFNMKDPIWGKYKELRHAFVLALDVEKMIQVQYSGQAVRAHSIFDPTQYGYDPKFRSKWASRDVKKAKELLAKAGYPDGKGLPPVHYPTSDSSTMRQLSEMMTRQLAEVGIVLNPEPMTWPEFMGHKRNRNFTIFGVAMSSNVPDADDSTGLVHSRGIPSVQNASAYSNPEIDKLADEIESMKNGPARLAKIARFREILDDDLPLAPMVHRIGNQLVQPWVKNYVYSDYMVLGTWLKFKKVETAK